MAPTKVSQSRRVMSSFHSQLAHHKHKRVYCCLCHAEVTVGCFVSHVQEKHGVSCATSCAFCYGQFRWQKGDVVRDLRVAHHRKRCLESFLTTHFERSWRLSAASVSRTEIATGSEEIATGLEEIATGSEEIATGLEEIATEKIATEAIATEEIATGLQKNATEEIATGLQKNATEEIATGLQKNATGSQKIAAPEFCLRCDPHHRHGVQPRLEGRERNKLWALWGFYDPYPKDELFFVDCGPKHVRFSEESGLGLCAFNIYQCFMSGEYAFYHLMVRVRLWLDFRIHRWEGVHFLPYSTLCDGFHRDKREERKEDDLNKLRIHHRHLLVAMKRDRVASFKTEWKSVAFRERMPAEDRGGPVRRQRDKLCVSIDSASHLMYAIAYVSRPMATCDGFGNKDATASGSHYWMFRELSSCAKLSLAALFEGGHETLVSKRHRDSNLANFYEHVERANQHWQVRLKHLAMKEKNCVLPLARKYEMSDTWAEDCPVVYVYGHAKYLKCVPELGKLEYDAWLRHQLLTGNHFWSGLRDEYYVLEHYQTRCMNTLQQVVKQVVDGVQNTFARKEILLQSVIGQLKNEMSQHVAEKEDILRVVAESQKHSEAVVLERETARNGEAKARKGEAKAQIRIEALGRKLVTTRKDVAKAQKRIRHLEVELKNCQSDERPISEQ
ncbi:hypothetical protein JTE90_026872 [Oedothorax gibbosus]|uniref:C2H2-type domain-containing protein n=1 Tax=Oedothorax gibbosus TaxID=931172 RepID=A0AAV6TS44_9ARAC|nr:hypothetical protein JTE90_026872 [Oedothorax gibbosus]